MTSHYACSPEVQQPDDDAIGANCKLELCLLKHRVAQARQAIELAKVAQMHVAIGCFCLLHLS
jgi:hypothetical protein